MSEQKLTREQIIEECNKIYAKYQIDGRNVSEADVMELIRLFDLYVDLKESSGEPKAVLGVGLRLKRAMKKLGYVPGNKYRVMDDESYGVITVMTPKERERRTVKWFFGLRTGIEEDPRTVIGKFFLEDGEFIGNVWGEENAGAMEDILKEAGFNISLLITSETTAEEWIRSGDVL